MLKFKGNWRFTPPSDGKWKNQTIPSEAISDFYDLISKTTTQGNRQEILEHFKGAFCKSVGVQHLWSSSESWAETDLINDMQLASENAPLFLEAFYEACVSLTKDNPDLFAPDEGIINDLCIKHNIGYEIRPPNLILREGEISPSETQNYNIFIKNPTAFTPPNVQMQPLKVFLCHSSGDKPKVRELYRRLLKEGLDPWLDEENLLPGHDWQLEIPKAVKSSDVVLVCLSKGSINKAGYVQKEIMQALDVADEQPEGAIFLIPLKLEECEVPERLRKWHWVNLFDENGYQRLMRSLVNRANTKDKTSL